MREIGSIDSLERASALLHPLRARILSLAVEPVSAVELARDLGESAQNVNYHLKALEKAGLLRKVREERRRNLTKAFYQAQARRLVFSSKLVEERGADARTARDQLSLNHLLGMARELERDVVGLLNRSKKEGAAAASLGVRADLAFPSGEARRAFLQEYMTILDGLVRRHGARAGAEPHERFTAMLAVYPARRSRAKKPRSGGSKKDSKA